MPQDQPELGQRPVERVVVDLNHLVPFLKSKICILLSGLVSFCLVLLGNVSDTVFHKYSC